MINLNLGIVKNSSNRIINHRSLIKVLLNPFLRIIGIQIASICENNEIKGICINKCKRQKLKFSFKYPIAENEILIKERKFI